ncbi:PSD1 and planctomycete cytochrome C domain-containing protein [Isosphaeraceae bacterium EP7]
MPRTILSLALISALSQLATADEPANYARDIRPILKRSCYGCHGTKKREAGLNLAARAPALAGGDDGAVIVPGKAAESRLIRYVSGQDEDHLMPPEGAGEPLEPAQIALLTSWINQGAAWPVDSDEKDPRLDHWSFRKPVRSTLPAVTHSDWPRNPVDAFILARLEKEGLAPSPEAPRAALIRRLSLDLIGLPPTVEEVDAFVADVTPNAYERLVDRLLASPNYGERWGRLWLDRARYADTNGYEKDRDRPIWPYRDWVVNALNADMPFDQFTVEQIAGDMLPGADVSQKVATGFHRNTMTNEEGGIDVEEFRFASIVDRVATTGTVWLGMTIQCAQCHTHKYDPITHREYYSFFALLNNVDEPEEVLPDPAVSARRAAIGREIAALESSREANFPESADPKFVGPLDRPSEERSRARAAERQASWESSQVPVAWTVLTPRRVVSKNHATMNVLPDGSVLATGDKPNQDVYDVEFEADLSGITALRLEVLPDPSLPDDGPGRAPLFSVGDFMLSEFQAKAGPATGDLTPLAFGRATEDFGAAKHGAATSIDGIFDTGWSIAGGVGKAHAAVFELKEPLAGGPGTRLALTLVQQYIHQTTIGRFRISATTQARPVSASGLPAAVEAALLVKAEDRTPEQLGLIRGHFLDVAPQLAEIRAKIDALKRSRPKHQTSLVMVERPAEHARTTKIHKRGEFLSETVPVETGVPAVLPPLPSDRPADRLSLAHWLVDPQNPLSPRVTVNHAWQALFGRGLVTTPDDFGVQGARPSHPELLDWLAVELVDRGWSLKTLHRLLVTSATYRQTSRVGRELLARDPANELLARGPRFRVEAETVRDLALSAAGLLDRRVGGPSVYPPQPDGVTALAYGQAAWPASVGADRYRRGMYTFTKRAAPYATFTLMDAPTPEIACMRRERSNTPLQALTLLNDVVFVEAARALALRALEPTGLDTEARARLAFRRCLSREPSAEELSALVAFHDSQLEHARAGRLDPAKLLGDDAKARPDVDKPEWAAWTTVARALLNLDETITRE